MKLLGIILIIVGVVALVYQGITFTTKEKVVDVGPVEVSADKKKTVLLPPILGVLAVAGGVALIIVGAKSS